ncbi:uncharacterized protein N0V89_005608 [Didymosphaeria variabile]|uniref:Subtelomeric hrmA-associated cluster protein AFUB-079030/YDR124W-like helical bundle domain-containing protein n=1 Tax=Didymosphaeria variabile TaxID=1932322 RepID=A0A9W8XMJ3_9PLEO|nr:uncharacterized protein N0V89_005608 [Didymosphaeria variabile]KAJ4353878.1 hypothetical protein N0V89_005608 [Didymosphaeria variabile]
MDLFSLVQNSDYVPPQKPKREPKSRAVEEDDTPLKSRIALGYLTVNGREEPVFAPIQGFEHLFTHEDVAAPRATEAAHNPSLAASSKKSHALKRRRTRNQDDNDINDAQDADEAHEPTAKVRPPETFSIGDVESLQAFYAARFRELTMKPMRDVVTAWVKRLEPRRQKKYGPYQRYEYNDDSDGRLDRKKSIKPPWWPTAVPYVEPSHLKLQHLVPLAVDMMMIHRRIDEEAGKRKYPSWISKLETDATYLVSSKDTEHFSSSRGARYNEAMKKRALEVILPR